MTQLKVAIIGAGAAGLAAAWDIARKGHAVHIYEAADRVGGLAAGFKDPTWNWTLEKFYHHWFENDHHILNLADEMGVRDQVIFPAPEDQLLAGRQDRAQRNLAVGAAFAPAAAGHHPHGLGRHVHQTDARAGSLLSA